MRQLLPYQHEAIGHVHSIPASGLFMDMGTGKTAAMLHAISDPKFPKPVLLCGPIRVIEDVWRQEAAIWPDVAHLSFSLLRGKPPQRRQAMEVKANIYLVNPEMLEEALASPYAPLYKSFVIDESSLFKNPSSKRFKNLRKHLGKFDKRVVMTGTPSPNSLLDLWSQVFILDQGKALGKSFYGFRERFFEAKDYLGYDFQPRPGALEKITELIAPLFYRVKDPDPIHPTHNKIVLQLPPKIRKMYKDMEKHYLSQITADKSITAPSAAAAMMKLRQVASGFVYDDEGGVTELHREKINAVGEILEVATSPIILVYQFKHELAAIKKSFPIAVEMGSGVVDRWTLGEIPLLLLHPQSGGHGLNLQHGGHTMIIFSNSFSLEYMSQTIARIARKGQKSMVVVHDLVVEDTLDEFILEVLSEKSEGQTNVLERIKSYATNRLRRT